MGEKNLSTVYADVEIPFNLATKNLEILLSCCQIHQISQIYL